jgi:Hereditary spastic paraplegia protein strumpellin
MSVKSEDRLGFRGQPIVELQNTEEVLDCLRGCNVAARWLMLHATGRHPRLGPAVAERLPPPAAVVAFVMDTALLEFEVRCGCPVLPRHIV